MEQHGHLEVCGGCMLAVDTDELKICSLVRLEAKHLHDDGNAFPFRELTDEEEPTLKLRVGTWLVQKVAHA